MNKKPLSIGIISDDFSPAMTGVGIHTQTLARELASRGHHIFILTSRRKGEPEESLSHNVRIYRLPTIKIYGFYQALPTKKMLRRILSKERPDIIHHHYLSFLMKQVFSVAKEIGLPQISTYHFTADVLTKPPLMRPFRHLIEHQVFSYNNQMTALIVPSLGVLSELQKTKIKTPLHHISNWITFDENKNIPAPSPNTPHPFTILFVGRLAYEKNISLLLRSFQIFLTSCPDAQLHIIGTGPLRETLEKECHLLGISSSVHFFGFIEHDDLPPYYAECDVFVLPSIVETQSIVLIEALYFARPILVTSSILSAREFVEDGKNGYIVDSKNENELASRLVTLQSNKNLCTSMGLFNKEKAKNYASKTIIDSLEDVYYHSLP